MVVLSRNANVATGKVGAENAAEIQRRVAEVAGITAGELLIGSTGVIGRPYPMAQIRRGLDELSWPFPAADFDASARAIMTTDTRHKLVRLRCGDAVIVGIAKGVVTAAGYPQYSEAAIYLLMLLVLLVRPRGLLGERIVRFE